MKICYLVERIGPYHAARLGRAGMRGEVVIVELNPDSTTYAWQTVKDDQRHYRREAVSGTTRTLGMILRSAAPDVVFLNGWADSNARAALHWCVGRGVPAVVMSDSQQQDEPRVFWKELIKRVLVSNCRSAFVAGRRHADYLRVLGFGARPIIQGYDVVDNEHFWLGAEKARQTSAETRSHLGLPKRYFLCVSRFVSKKNLLSLLRAFSAYRLIAGADCNLVLVGDGEKRAEVEAEIARANLRDVVFLPGFQQYEKIPAYYGLSEALVLPSITEQWGLVVNEAMASGLPVLVSKRCGCAPELVQDGGNGWTFDPLNENELVKLLIQMTQQSSEDLAAMGNVSRRIIAEWSLERFADGLWQAAKGALSEATAHPWIGTELAARRILLSLLAPTL